MKFQSLIQSTAKFRRTWAGQWPRYLGQLTLFAAIVVGVQLWQSRDVAQGVAPDMEMAILQTDGTVLQTTLRQWRHEHPNQAIALHFWADWCPICRLEENSVSRLMATQAVLPVAMQSGNPQQVQRVLTKRELTWPSAIDQQGTMAHAFGIQAVPAFVVIDAKGQIKTPSVGYTSEIGMRLRLWWASW